MNYYNQISSIIDHYKKYLIELSPTQYDKFIKSKDKNKYLMNIGYHNFPKNYVDYLIHYYDKTKDNRISNKYSKMLKNRQNKMMKDIKNLIDKITNHQEYINHYHFMQRILPMSIDADEYYKEYKLNDDDIYDMRTAEQYIISQIYKKCKYVQTFTASKYLRHYYNTMTISDRDLKIIQPIIKQIKCIDIKALTKEYKYPIIKKLIPLDYINKKKITIEKLSDFWFNSDNLLVQWHCFILSSVEMLLDIKEFQELILNSKSEMGKVLRGILLKGDDNLRGVCDILIKNYDKYNYLGFTTFVFEPYIVINDIINLLDINVDDLFRTDINNKEYVYCYYLNKNKFGNKLKETDINIKPLGKYLIICINNKSIGTFGNKCKEEKIKEYPKEIFGYHIYSCIKNIGNHHYEYFNKNFILKDNNRSYYHCLVYRK